MSHLKRFFNFNNNSLEKKKTFPLDFKFILMKNPIVSLTNYFGLS